VVLAGGCVCCAIREDLVGAIRQLCAQREQGEIPAFSRLVLETTGLADPVPVLVTLHAAAPAAASLEVTGTITTVDGVLGLRTLAEFPQAVQQVVAADTLLITKADLARPEELETLQRTIEALNPWAPVMVMDLHTDNPARAVGSRLVRAPSHDAGSTAWMGRSAHEGEPQGDHGHGRPNVSPAGVRSVSCVFDEPLDWTAFGIWLTMLLHRHGKDVLRIKGILQVAGTSAPVAFHSVQHLVHPPLHLEAWPSEDHRSRLTCIVRHLDGRVLERSLRAFQNLRLEAQVRRGNASGTKGAGAGGTGGGRPIRRPTAPSWIKG
jgi:G3E family GTPase